MKRKTIVVANWKMNGDSVLINTMAERLNSLDISPNVTVFITPSSPYLMMANNAFTHKNINICAQNISQFDSGAYTGEISANMLKDLTINYVIIGHSERRMYYQDTNVIIAEKVKRALSNGITPILCIGETEQQREDGLTEQVLVSQLQAVIDEVGLDKFNNIILSYEPVWAIGSGKTASPEIAQETHACIRNFFSKLNKNISAELSILYGGSVNAENSKKLIAQADIDGVLIGGVSLKVDDFSTICSTL